jgi:hypothetical protein
LQICPSRLAAPSYRRRQHSPAEAAMTPRQHQRVKSGITKIWVSALCVLAAAWDDAEPRLDVPRGFTASLYACGIDGARNLDVRADGTLTVDGGGDHFEIAPATADEPRTVMRVAAELDAPAIRDVASLAVQAPRFVQLRWNADSGELGYTLRPDSAAGIPVAPRTLDLARHLAHRHHADVAMAPDGTLYVADAQAGAVWRVRPVAL